VGRDLIKALKKPEESSLKTIYVRRKDEIGTLRKRGIYQAVTCKKEKVHLRINIGSEKGVRKLPIAATTSRQNELIGTRKV